MYIYREREILLLSSLLLLLLLPGPTEVQCSYRWRERGASASMPVIGDFQK